MRQIKARKRRLGTQFNRTRRIKTLCNNRRCGRRGACVAANTGDDPIAVSGTGKISRRNRTAQLQTPIRSAHPRCASLKLDRAQKRGHAPIKHGLDVPAPPIGAVAPHPHADAVAVQKPAHLRRRQEYILGEPDDAQKAEAAAICAHRPFHNLAIERLLAALGSALRARLCAALRRRFLRGKRPAVTPPVLSASRRQLTVPVPMRTFRRLPCFRFTAQVAELVDALVSGTSG